MPSTKSKAKLARSRKSPSAKKSSAKKLSPGTKVSWRSAGATIRGVVKRKLTGPMKIKSHQVKATPEHPEYLVQSAKTGALAAHSADSLQTE